MILLVALFVLLVAFVDAIDKWIRLRSVRVICCIGVHVWEIVSICDCMHGCVCVHVFVWSCMCLSVLICDMVCLSVMSRCVWLSIVVVVLMLVCMRIYALVHATVCRFQCVHVGSMVEFVWLFVRLFVVSAVCLSVCLSCVCQSVCPCACLCLVYVFTNVSNDASFQHACECICHGDSSTSGIVF